MADAFIGEIRVFGGNYAPAGWALCNGQEMSISQYSALFAVIGTSYGGDGVKTFALPNLQDRAVLHQGAGPGLTPRNVGQTGGSATVNLIPAQMASHTHVPQGNSSSGSATTSSPQDHFWGTKSGRSAPLLYGQDSSLVPMSANALQAVGGNQPHNNMQPYVGMTFIICLEGYFPSRS